LCIRLQRWPIQRIRAERPELEAKPIVLCETRRASRRVAACSTEAEALGIAVGMPFAEATALAGAEKLRPEAYDPSGDREALEALAVECARFSPLVGLDDSPTPDSLLLDVTGLAHLFGGEPALAAAITRDFARRGLTAHVALAPTIGAAWAVAHFLQDKQAACGFAPPSQTGRSRKRLSAATIIPPDGTAAALRPLPVEALRLSDDVVELLHSLGIYHIGQLESLPREDLTTRFGPQLLERWDQATGRRAEPIRAQPQPHELRVERSLDYPTTRRRTIELVVEQLIGQLARMLVREGRGAVRLDCRLHAHPSHTVNLSVGLFEPSAAPRHLFELIRMQLDRVWLASPVSAVSVEAALTAPFERRQEELFADGRSWRRPRQLAGLVDRLAGRLGRGSVLRARLIRDAEPELAYQYEPLVAGCHGHLARAFSDALARRQCHPTRKVKVDRRLAHKRHPGELPPRPLRLLARPFRLAVVSIMPDGPPLQFQLEGRPERITHTWGPERIETGWWRGRPVRRDYYQTETTTGRRYWLFRDLAAGAWFLHGTFE